MDLLNCQRTVFAFHGFDRRVRDAVLLGKQKLLAASTPMIGSTGSHIQIVVRNPKAIVGYFYPEGI